MKLVRLITIKIHLVGSLSDWKNMSLTGATRKAHWTVKLNQLLPLITPININHRHQRKHRILCVSTGAIVEQFMRLKWSENRFAMNGVSCYHTLWTRELYQLVICFFCIFLYQHLVLGACPQRSLIKPCTCHGKNRGFDILCEGKPFVVNPFNPIISRALTFSINVQRLVLLECFDSSH